MEKGFNFYSNGKFYRYSTSIDDSELPGENGEEALRPIANYNTVVRAFTLFNCAIMQREADSKISL